MDAKKSDILILGAGAAGLMAAGECAKSDKTIRLIEHNKNVGKKILISGGGRCNFTNMFSSSEDFVCSNHHFNK